MDIWFHLSHAQILSIQHGQTIWLAQVLNEFVLQVTSPNVTKLEQHY